MNRKSELRLRREPLMDRNDEIQTNVLDTSVGVTQGHKEKTEKMTDELLQFGFAVNQAKIYIYLGKYGPKSASEIFNSLQLPRSETYFILNLLQSKGIVSAEFSSPTKYYAVPLEQTLSILVNIEKEKLNKLVQKQNDLIKLWDSIPSSTVEINKNKSEKLQMVQGVESVYTKIKNMIVNSKNGILIFCSEKDLAGFHHANITDMLPEDLNVKIIISPAEKIPRFLDIPDKKIVRCLPDSSTQNQCYIIKDNDEVLCFLRNTEENSNKIFAVWSDSKSLIDSMSTLFSYSWDNAKRGK